MNPIEKWITNDQRLDALIEEIESTEKSYSEKAEMAFERLCIMYKIPRMPEDIIENEDDVTKQRSLFEEYAIIKYLSEEDEDPRGMVLSAAWHLLNSYQIDLKEVALKEFGGNIPDRCLIGFKGNGIKGEIVFPQKENKSWFDLGCITCHIVS